MSADSIFSSTLPSYVEPLQSQYRTTDFRSSVHCSVDTQYWRLKVPKPLTQLQNFKFAYRPYRCQHPPQSQVYSDFQTMDNVPASHRLCLLLESVVETHHALSQVLLGTGVGQIRYLNRALMRFDSKHVIPTQFVMCVAFQARVRGCLLLANEIIGSI
jgi:hypothetical protein